jgi:tetratricopeptide (TPR) repeat protein
MLVQDYQNAIDDLNQVLMRRSDFVLAYFNRAVLRQRQLEVQEREATTPNRDLTRRKMEFELVVRDLDKVIELSPTFVYAYYNRASVSAALNNFDAALADLNRAIELYPSFAEAYYNRGLIYLRQGRTKAGTVDLSKAGELGLAQAYSVLKRANN